jgi:GNAT superfamily N-acetyltransferase
MILRILQKLFNAPPWEDAEFITDNHGQKFWLSWSDGEDIAKLRLYHRGLPAGHVNLMEENFPTLELADICLSSQYRSRGLGKQMMKMIVQWAKQNDFQEIVGGIVPRDDMSLAYLQEWYQHQGFKVRGKNMRMELK